MKKKLFSLLMICITLFSTSRAGDTTFDSGEVSITATSHNTGDYDNWWSWFYINVSGTLYLSTGIYAANYGGGSVEAGWTSTNPYGGSFNFSSYASGWGFDSFADPGLVPGQVWLGAIGGEAEAWITLSW